MHSDHTAENGSCVLQILWNRTEFTVDTIGKGTAVEQAFEAGIADASHKYMSRVSAAPRFAAADAEEAARSGTADAGKIPDEVWKSYLDGTAGQRLREQRVREKERAHVSPPSIQHSQPKAQAAQADCSEPAARP